MRLDAFGIVFELFDLMGFGDVTAFFDGGALLHALIPGFEGWEFVDVDAGPEGGGYPLDGRVSYLVIVGIFFRENGSSLNWIG